MNIFDNYLEKIKKIVIELSKKNKLIIPSKLDGITAEVPPSKFNSDISTNVAMFLSKSNQKKPEDIANIIVQSIKEEDKFNRSKIIEKCSNLKWEKV